MKEINLLMKYSAVLKFDGISSIPMTMVKESIMSECRSSLANSNTYWDHFQHNIRRSNVLKAQIEKQCLAGTDV